MRSRYRPISLLNVDLKILSKILALCLQRVLPNIIAIDQTGFMLGRHSFHNTRRRQNIISAPSLITPKMIISLDAEKAFDRVEWSFLFFVLQKFDFTPEFISWIILLIYADPVASIHTNGLHSAISSLLWNQTRLPSFPPPICLSVSLYP